MAAFCEVVEPLGSIHHNGKKNKKPTPAIQCRFEKTMGSSTDCFSRQVQALFVFIISIFTYRVEWTKRARYESIDSHAERSHFRSG